MKKQGDVLTIKGQIDSATYNNRIYLFDGKFTTGFRILDLVIETATPQDGNEMLFTVSTEPSSALITSWDWSDNTQIAWANCDMPTSSRDAYFSLVDRENLVVEDIWLSAYSTTEAKGCNYYMTLQKYSFPDWTGALAMVKNRSQT